MLRGCLPFAILVAVISVLSTTALAQQSQVAWRTDFEGARREAHQTGRNLLVHFWAPWCGPCQRLDAVVFSQPPVAAAIQQDLIPVKLNADEFPNMARAYGVDRLPTDLVLRVDGTLLARFASPQEPSAYIATLARLSREGSQAAAAQAQVAHAPARTNQQPALQAAYSNLNTAPGSAAPNYNLAAAQQSLHSPQANVYPPGASPATATQSQNYALSPPASGNDAGTTHGRYGQGGQGFTPGMTNSSSPSYGGVNDPAYSSRYGGVAAASQPTIEAPSVPADTSQQVAWPGAGGAANDFLRPNGVHRENTANQMAIQSPQIHVSSGGGQQHPTASAPVDRPPIGMDGFCAVTLRHEQRWVPGDERFGIVHRGRLYLFAGPEHQQQFWSDPDRYSPVLSGIDPVLALDSGASVAGRREHGVEYDGLIYLFSSESTLEHFSKNPQRYVGGVRQAMLTSQATRVQ